MLPRGLRISPVSLGTLLPGIHTHSCAASPGPSGGLNSPEINGLGQKWESGNVWLRQDKNQDQLLSTLENRGQAEESEFQLLPVEMISLLSKGLSTKISQASIEVNI